MMINPFVAGVLSTLFVELIVLFAAAFMYCIKISKKNKQ